MILGPEEGAPGPEELTSSDWMAGGVQTMSVGYRGASSSFLYMCRSRLQRKSKTDESLLIDREEQYW